MSELYGKAAQATAQGSKSFYYATRFLPPAMARSAHAVYWFCRYTDDLVDECESSEQGRRDLDQWATALEQAWGGEARSDHHVLKLFVDTARRHDIPREYPFGLIEGVRMDLDQVRYETFEQLRVFCYRVASIVGLMMCHVIGFESETDRERAVPHAVDLGIAMQLTNILRDIRDDVARGRMYLPREEMEAFGCTEEDLRRGKRTASFCELIRFQAARARHCYENGNSGIPLLNREGRFAVKLASDIYREILNVIEQPGFDVFERRAVVGRSRKRWLAVRNLAGPVMRRSAERLGFGRHDPGVRTA